MSRSRNLRLVVSLAALLGTAALAHELAAAARSSGRPAGRSDASGDVPAADRHRGTGRPSASPGVEGRVRDASGHAIAGARIVAWRVDPETHAEPVKVGTTRTDAGGAFLLRRLGTGTFEIEVGVSGYRLARIGVHLPEGSTSLFPLEVRLATVAPSPSAPSGVGPENAPGRPEARVAGDEVPSSPTAAAAAERGPDPARADLPTSASSSSTVAPVAGRETATDATDGAARDPETTAPSSPTRGASAAPSDAPAGDVGARILEAREAIEAGDLRRARRLLEAVGAVRPEDADAFYAMGEGLLRAGETAEAVRFLREALVRDPSNVEAHFRCALGLLGLGRDGEARVEFETVLELRPQGALADGARRALVELAAPAGGE